MAEFLCRLHSPLARDSLQLRRTQDSPEEEQHPCQPKILDTQQTTVVASLHFQGSPFRLFSVLCWLMAVHHRATIKSHGRQVSIPTQLFIGGTFVSSQSGPSLASVHPSTGDLLATVHAASAADVDAAVAAARSALEPRPGSWASLPPAERGVLMQKLAALVEARADDLAFLESMDVGKPYFESRNFDITQVLLSLKYFAGWADKLHGDSIPVPAGPAGERRLAYTTKVLVGVCSRGGVLGLSLDPGKPLSSLPIAVKKHTAPAVVCAKLSAQSPHARHQLRWG